MVTANRLCTSNRSRTGTDGDAGIGQEPRQAATNIDKQQQAATSKTGAEVSEKRGGNRSAGADPVSTFS
jgi:hypothetical protein